MTELNISSEEAFTSALQSSRGLLCYFSTLSCSVGEALEPKVRDLLRQDFPKLDFAWIDMNAIFYGVSLPEDQARQVRGEVLPMPEIE